MKRRAAAILTVCLISAGCAPTPAYQSPTTGDTFKIEFVHNNLQGVTQRRAEYGLYGDHVTCSDFQLVLDTGQFDETKQRTKVVIAPVSPHFTFLASIKTIESTTTDSVCAVINTVPVEEGTEYRVVGTNYGARCQVQTFARASGGVENDWLPVTNSVTRIRYDGPAGGLLKRGQDCKVDPELEP